MSPTTPRNHQQPLKSSGRDAKGTWWVWCLHGTCPPPAQRHLYLRLGGVLLQSPLIPLPQRLDEDPLLLSAGLAGVPHPTHPPRAWWATGPGFWPGSVVRTPGVIFGGIPGFPPLLHPSRLQADRQTCHPPGLMAADPKRGFGIRAAPVPLPGSYLAAPTSSSPPLACTPPAPGP